MECAFKKSVGSLWHYLSQISLIFRNKFILDIKWMKNKWYFFHRWDDSFKIIVLIGSLFVNFRNLSESYISEMFSERIAFRFHCFLWTCIYSLIIRDALVDIFNLILCRIFLSIEYVLLAVDSLHANVFSFYERLSAIIVAITIY